MTEADRPPAVDKYEYFQGLTIGEIKAHLDGLAEGFEEVKSHYAGPLGRRRTKIRSEDMGKILGAFEDLLPMTTNSEVQQEAIEAIGMDTGRPEDLVIDRITGMTQEVLLFAAGFENSGITAIPMQGSPFA